MKKIVLFSLMMACMPFMVLAQSGNDDLYFIPKKKTEKKEKVTTPAKVVVELENTPKSVDTAPVSSPIVVKDVNGKVRDVDEYNRRYTSKENEFSYVNDTLYIQEKPSYEQGEWINGFQGSQTDYDYAMRIVRFRNPRYAVSISSPYYWDVISLGYSWDWNVYDDGFYAYAFPTFGNPYWWDWRYNYPWRSYSWYYPSSWYYSSSWWYGGYWGCYPPHIHHSHWHHFPPHYAHGGVGGYWGSGHGWNGSSAYKPGIHSGRYADNHRREAFPARTDRNSRNDYVNVRRTGSTDQTVNRNNGNAVRNSSGRVVTSKDGSSSVRPQRAAAKARSGQAVSTGATTSDTRSSSVYTRQVQGRSSSYNRASSTRSTVTNSGSWNNNSGKSYNNSSSSSRGSGGGGSYSSGSSRSSSSASYSSGSSSGSGRSASSGGTSRGSGGRR